jgi:hypothetical protein
MASYAVTCLPSAFLSAIDSTRPPPSPEKLWIFGT